MSSSLPPMRMGVDLGGTKISAVLLDAHNSELARHRLATPQGDYAATLAAIAEVVGKVTENIRPSQHLDLPVGIGTPGAARADGTMVNCNSQCLNGQNLRRDLRDLLNRDVRLANDADCFALSEYRLHRVSGMSGAQSLQSGPAGDRQRELGLLFGVILGTGVGGGWVYRGELMQGPNALTGEWGHTPLAYFGSDSNQCATLSKLEAQLADRACYCGRVNCVETFLSGPGLAQTHAELWDDARTAQKIAQLASISEDASAAGRDAEAATDAAQNAATTLALYISMLGRCLAQVINAVDPGVIVLGGGISNIARLYDELPLAVARSLFGREDCATPILRARGGDDSGLYGAANLFL